MLRTLPKEYATIERRFKCDDTGESGYVVKPLTNSEKLFAESQMVISGDDFKLDLVGQTTTLLRLGLKSLYGVVDETGKAVDLKVGRHRIGGRSYEMCREDIYDILPDDARLEILEAIRDSMVVKSELENEIKNIASSSQQESSVTGTSETANTDAPKVSSS